MGLLSRLSSTLTLVNVTPYNSRETRNKFLASRFSQNLFGDVLNIGGGGSKHLRSFISPRSYTEVDIAGSPDLIFDLDSGAPLPFENDTFDTVVCTDVLEHLEHFHLVFSELIRVSRSDVIISLPSLSTVLRSYITRSRYIPENTVLASHSFGTFSKYYGLPFYPPEDRHRWLFSYTEASDFFHYHTLTYSYKVVDEFGIGLDGYTPVTRFFKKLLASFLPTDLYNDFFAWSYWVHIQKH